MSETGPEILQPSPIEADLNVPFLLFPSEQPIPYQDITTGQFVSGPTSRIVQSVHIKNLGKLIVDFGDAFTRDPEEMESWIEIGQNAVILNENGPIELTKGKEGSTQAGRRVSQASIIQLIAINFEPENETVAQNPPTIRIYSARFAGTMPADQVTRDEPEIGVISYFGVVDEQTKADCELLVENRPEVLRQIRLEVS